MLCALFLAGCTTTEPVKVDKAAQGQPPIQGTQGQPDAAKEEEAKPKVFKIGETVKMGELEFTLNSERWDKGNQFMKPEKGKR